MRARKWNSQLALSLALALSCASAVAKLPAQTPEQQQAAAAKKAQAAVQQEKEKQQLADSMDKIAERWRGRATKEGLKTNPATPISTAAGAPTTAAPTTAAQANTTGQPDAATPAASPAIPLGPHGLPIRSEKFGTAPLSEDVKTNERSGTRMDSRIYKNPVEEAPHKKPPK